MQPEPSRIASKPLFEASPELPDPRVTECSWGESFYGVEDFVIEREARPSTVGLRAARVAAPKRPSFVSAWSVENQLSLEPGCPRAWQRQTIEEAEVNRMPRKK